MANADDFKRITGEAFNIKDADKVEARNFVVRSDKTNNVISCTLWNNSHGHVEIENGDTVFISGTIKTTPKKDGDGVWVNLSVRKIGVVPMDAGTRDTDGVARPAGQRETDTEEPDVL